MTKITTLNELAKFINENDNWNAQVVNEAIFGNGWKDETHIPNGIARNGKEVCRFNDDCIAYVA